MIKTIIKEGFIIILLCIAIALIMGILFYDYIPVNKVVPTKEAYFTPNDVKEEISEEITEIEKTEVSYEITDSDLDLYKKSSSYKPGKKNPFSLVSEESSNNGGDSSNGDNNKNNNDNNDKEESNEGNDNKNTDDKKDTDTKENKDTSSTNTFYDDKGIK